MGGCDGEITHVDETGDALVGGVDGGDARVESSFSLEDVDVGFVFGNERRVADDFGEGEERAREFARDEVCFDVTARNGRECDGDTLLFAVLRHPLRSIEETKKRRDDFATGRTKSILR